MSPVYVVIPYYQRDGQPLVRAIQSILDQRHVPLPEVIIVDDGSPFPAERVVEENFRGCANLRIINQDNAGASAARNTGLDSLPNTAEYVAFLDSDDEWMPEHLARALMTLAGGCDFFFADHQRTEWAGGKFTVIDFEAGAHECIDPVNHLYHYIGDPLLPIMRDHLVQTSTVVLRWAPVRDLRFRTDLVLGEDELYWVEAIRRTGRIGFSGDIDAYMGKGVNISQNADQSCLKEIELITQNLYFWKNVPAYLPGEAAIESLRISRIQQLRVNYSAAVLRCLKAGRIVPIRSLLRFTLSNPAWLVSLNNQILCYVAGKCGIGK